MASYLLRLTRSVFPFRPTVPITLSPFRLPTTHHHSDNNKTRSFCSLPKILPFDLSFLNHQMQLISRAPSMLITLLNAEEVTVNIPGMTKTETDNGPCVSVHMPGLRVPKGQHSKTVISNKRVVDDNLLVVFQTDAQVYLAGIKLPHNLDRKGTLDVFILNGVFNVTIPVVKSNTDNNYIMPDFVDATVKLPRPTIYCDMFYRSDMGRGLCEIIARSDVKSKSFTAYKKDTGESIYLKGNMPGVENIVVTTEGLCVSLNMPGFEIEDVVLAFEYDTLMIEGKRGNEHYIAGIRVPEGFHREEHMIKREMQDGVYKATLPHVDADRRAFSAYR